MIDLRGRRVAVTGADGFIGAHLVERLASAGAEVLCLGRAPTRADPDLLRSGRVRVLEAESPGRRYAVPYALAGCESLVHLAYRPPAADGGDRRAEELDGNLRPTVELLGVAAEAGILHVTFASTADVYGEGTGLHEGAPLAAETPYALAKRCQEQAVARWSADTHRPAAILRLSTVYGPREPVRRAIPAFIDSVIAGAPPVVSGDGRGPFDPVYVGDVVDAFALAVEGRVDGVFNIGTGVARAPADVAAVVVRTIGARLPVLHNRFAPDRPRPVLDVRRARAALGFSALTPLEAGLAAEAAWARART